MNDFPSSESRGAPDLPHLKRVSRIKHTILERYFPSWAVILASQHSELSYFDCFAGPGAYEFEGKLAEGSPIIAVKAGIELLNGRKGQRLHIYLIEDDANQVQRLENGLKPLRPYPENLTVEVKLADSRRYIPDLLERLGRFGPAFFLIDPYGHPLSIPVINRILGHGRTEALINLMWFRINMDLPNPNAEARLDELCGDKAWRTQPFMAMHGFEREQAFIDYFRSRLSCKFVLPFRLRYDPEDVQGGNRTKYYLLHASNHAKAALLMKEVMWPLGDEEGTFDYSGTEQGVLISRTPSVEELKIILTREFKGQEIGFEELREKTWKLPFIEKHYREAIKGLEGKGARIRRISSKRTGISGKDRILFE
ncbi:MAG TPA: three-Cys-motif partner protein TcmP [Candidatus Acidoferrales bacterium]|nr:three-Cys-motif partner protein TcmP [Candidatus Acidoferrales bacterium]